MRLQRPPFFQLNYPGRSRSLYYTVGSGSCNACSLKVAASVGRGLTVAVGAQHAQVFESIIALDAVDVVKMHVK
jgi:hypothetical protein